jgi:hypothetical protein
MAGALSAREWASDECMNAYIHYYKKPAVTSPRALTVERYTWI